MSGERLRYEPPPPNHCAFPPHTSNLVMFLNRPRHGGHTSTTSSHSTAVVAHHACGMAGMDYNVRGCLEQVVRGRKGLIGQYRRAEWRRAKRMFRACSMKIFLDIS